MFHLIVLDVGLSVVEGVLQLGRLAEGKETGWVLGESSAESGEVVRGVHGGWCG